MREHGRDIVMIGHAGHPEVEGTMGQVEGGIYLVDSVADVARLVVRDPRRLAYVTQTTLSVDDAAAIVAALKRASRASSARSATTSATRRRTARTR